MCESRNLGTAPLRIAFEPFAVGLADFFALALRIEVRAVAGEAGPGRGRDSLHLAESRALPKFLVSRNLITDLTL